MIKGIGTDITDNNRFKDFINDSKKIVRLLSSKEIEKFNLISNDERKIEYMASRFAAKEALFKASNKKFNMNEVSILNDEAGRPFVESEIDFNNVYLSISHERQFSIAFVVITEK